jgi:Flavin containing amine oxidoreductase
MRRGRSVRTFVRGKGHDMRIGIVGAGLSGLATAFYVKRARPDAELVVFESNPGPGGAMHTEVIEGFRFEAGPNGFLTNKPDCLQLVQDSGAAEHLLPSSELARKRYIYTDRLHRMPESPPLFVKSKLLSWPQKLRMAGEVFVPARREGPEESLRDFGNRRLGAGFTSVFLDAMSAGIYGSTPDKLSVEAAFPLVVALEREYGGLFRGMIAKRKKEAGPGGVLTSTRGGISTLANHLRGVIQAEWRFSEPVQTVERAGARFRVTSAAGLTEVDRVVICATSYAAAGMVQPLDAELARRLAAIAYSPIADDFCGAPADPRRAVGQQHFPGPRAARLQEHSGAARRAAQPGAREPGRGGVDPHGPRGAGEIDGPHAGRRRDVRQALGPRHPELCARPHRQREGDLRPSCRDSRPVSELQRVSRHRDERLRAQQPGTRHAHCAGLPGDAVILAVVARSAPHRAVGMVEQDCVDRP